MALICTCWWNFVRLRYGGEILLILLDLLEHRLSSGPFQGLGGGSTVLPCFNSSFGDWFQSVLVNGKRSTQDPYFMGCHRTQHSPFHNIYMGLLDRIICYQRVKYHQYGDDTQLYILTLGWTMFYGSSVMMPRIQMIWMGGINLSSTQQVALVWPAGQCFTVVHSWWGDTSSMYDNHIIWRFSSILLSNEEWQLWQGGLCCCC